MAKIWKAVEIKPLLEKRCEIKLTEAEVARAREEYKRLKDLLDEQYADLGSLLDEIHEPSLFNGNESEPEQSGEPD